MPRSGTTLVEQIISSHNNVFGAGEIGYLSKLIYDNFFDKNNIKFYSSHPKFIFPYASNSTHSHNKFDISNFKKLAS